MTQPKGHHTAKHLWLLGLLIGLPLALMIGKLSWLPTSEVLRQFVSLSGVPGEMSDRVSYVLFIPLGALVVVVVRLTLGIRVLGPFRSILLADSETSAF